MRTKLIKLLTMAVGVPLVFWWLIFMINLIPTKSIISIRPSGDIFFKKLAEVKKESTKFTVEGNNLNRLDVLFKNPNLESRDLVEISLKEANGTTVASKEFSGFNLGDTSYARMDFSPQASVNKSYILEIRPIKIVDGKLNFGFTEGKIVFDQYYLAKFSLQQTLTRTNEVWLNLWSNQTGVVLVPVLLGVWWLW